MAAHHTRTGHRLAQAVVFAALAAGFAAPALAQNVPQSVPLPAKKPANITGSIMAPQGAQAQAQAPAQRTQAPSPIINPFAGLLGKGSSAGLNPEQRAIIDRVNNYLTGMQVLSGKFVQVGPDGRKTQGQFYISKPGKVRFEYDDPSQIELVADGTSVVVRDRKLATQDVYPLSQTPLRFLLADKVDLMKDSSLTAVYADDVFTTVVVEEKNGIVGTSRLMIMFDAKNMQLKQWTVTDPQGYDTTVALRNLDATKRPDPELFKIN
jgi:outer membrane lipoprotein-sorting protein